MSPQQHISKFVDVHRGTESKNGECAAPGTEPKSMRGDMGRSLALDAFLHENRKPWTAGAAEGGNQHKYLTAGPHGMFHAHAHDMSYLEQWLGDVLDLTCLQHAAKAGGSSQPTLPQS